MNMKIYLSGSLKVVLAISLGLSTNIAFAADNPRDFINRNNYLPGGKYRLFGNGRGAVTDLRGNVLSQGTIAYNTGPIQTTITSFSGKIEYNQEFHNHGWQVHSPFSSSASRSFDSKKGSPATGGQTVTNFNIQASEVHPADGYDGEQGGGYPTPTGARDEYTYLVNGTVRTIRVVNPDKPQPPKSDNKPNSPYNGNGSDSGNNGQPENNSDNSREDQIRQENADSQGENDAVTENGELKPQQDITKNDSSPYYGDTCIDCGVDPNKLGYGGDFQQVDNKGRNPLFNPSIKNIEDSEAYNSAARKLMDEVGRFGDDAANAAKKAAQNVAKSAKDAKKLSNSKADDLAREQGFKNAHDLKKQNLKGQRDTTMSHYNMYYNSKTKELFLKHESTGKFIKVD